MKKVCLFLILGVSFNLNAQAAEIIDNAEPWFESRLDTQVRTCVAFVEVQVCDNQKICRVVCGAAGGAAGAALAGSVGAGAGVGASTAICNEVCEAVPKCRMVPTCTQWEYGQ